MILPSIALKHLNVPDNLDIKGKTVAGFLIRSHFLSIEINMLIKEKISHGTIQTVCHLHNGMYHPIHLCHIWISFTLSPPLCYSLKISNFRMREKKILCIYVTLSVSRYVKGGRESYFQAHVFLNNPY